MGPSGPRRFLADFGALSQFRTAFFASIFADFRLASHLSAQFFASRFADLGGADLQLFGGICGTNND